MIARSRYRQSLRCVAASLALCAGHSAFGQASPVLTTIFPAGAQAGQAVEVTLTGDNLEEHLPPLNCAIATLIKDLECRGLLNDVIIYCVGEFGRTPGMNGHAGHAGRDHWSDCFSVLLAGGGIQRGRIVGASEKWEGGVHERLVTPLDLLATIYHSLGIPLDLHFEDSSGRPVSIVGGGKPIQDLL